MNFFSLLGKETLERAPEGGLVGRPGGLHLKVIIQSLVSEEQVLVTPLAGDEVAVQNEVTNMDLSSTELLRGIHAIHLVEGGASWHSRQLVHVLRVVGGLVLGEEGVHVGAGLESEREGQLQGLLALAELIVGGEVLETDLLDILGGSSKLFPQNLSCSSGGGSDVVGEVVGEEVPVVRLSIDAEHRHKVGGVHATSEELESHSGGKGLALRGSSSRRESDQTVVGSLKDTSVVVVGGGLELDLSDGSDGVDVLSPSSKELA
mmetsp:Transcript_17491/g.29445  ORF Transcript_17491/g.29445 Transcript_17491/m.29445 type:complete len:262 (-) Transcript_17491:343-1128(-)